MQRNCNSDEINLLDYLNVIKRHKKLIGVIVGAVTVVTIIVSLITPKYYNAKAVIMPIGKGGGGGLSALAGQFGGLASLVGVGGVGTQTLTTQFLALLNTRTLAEEMINKHDLVPIIFEGSKPGEKLSMESAVGGLLGSVKFMDDKKNGTIIISAEFKDPKLAAEVANGYVEGLQKFINGNAFTVAKRNRIFIEEQLSQNKRDLLEAGKELNEFYKGGRVSSVESKIDVPITGGLQGVDTPPSDAHNDTVIELEKLQKQEAEIATVLNQRPTANDQRQVVKDVPQQVYLQYLTLRRNLLTQINTLLTQQYEMAKIDEAKDELAFQVIDPARIPEKRFKPRRKQMVMVAFVSSLLIGIFAAFSLEYTEKMRSRSQIKS